MRDQAADGLRSLEKIDAMMSAAPGYPDDLPAHLFYPWLTLRHGVIRRRAMVEWIDETLDRLERRPATDDEPIPPESFQELMRLLQLLGGEGNPAARPPGDEEKKR